MARVLLVGLALLSFAAALIPLGLMTLSAGPAWVALLASDWRSPDGLAAIEIAVAVALLAVPLAFLLAGLLSRAVFWARVVALGGCVVLLMGHGAGIKALPTHYPADEADVLNFLLAVSRALAAGVLLLTAGAFRIPANLRTAARAAGARPVQAWFHASLAPLAWPLLAAFVAASMIGLAAGPLRSTLIADFAVFRVRALEPALLLAIVGISALGAALRRRPA